MSSMKFITQDGLFHITSYANGWAYTVHKQGTNLSLFVQDHDAETLQRESSNFEDSSVLNQYIETLGEEE